MSYCHWFSSFSGSEFLLVSTDNLTTTNGVDGHAQDEIPKRSVFLSTEKNIIKRPQFCMKLGIWHRYGMRGRHSDPLEGFGGRPDCIGKATTVWAEGGARLNCLLENVGIIMVCILQGFCCTCRTEWLSCKNPPKSGRTSMPPSLFPRFAETTTHRLRCSTLWMA